MPDFRVRFVGDLNNLAQFDAAIRNTMGSSSKALDLANEKLVNFGGKGVPIFNAQTSGAGEFRRNTLSTIDSVNRTFIQSGEKIRRVISGYTTAIDEAGNHVIQPLFSDEYIGKYKQVIGNLDQYYSAIKNIEPIEKKVAAAQLQGAIQQIVNLEKQEALQARINAQRAAAGSIASNKLIAVNPLEDVQDRFAGQSYGYAIQETQAKLAQVEQGILTRIPAFTEELTTKLGQPFVKSLSGPNEFQYVERLQNDLQNIQRAITTGISQEPGIGFGQALNPGELDRLKAQAQYLEATLNNIPKTIAFSRESLDTQLKGYQETLAQDTGGITAEISALEAELKRLQALGIKNAGALESRLATLLQNPAYAGLDKALNATPPIQANLASTLQQSKQLRQQLLNAGLGGGAKYDLSDNSAFSQALAKQEAAVTRYTRNIRTGVTTVEGYFKQMAKDGTTFGNAQEKFTADIDKNGKVITRWGGQLSGAGNILRQTVRDFQKVIEWTIATTAVFGTLGLAVSSLKTINDLNTALTRFSITAQVSVGDAQQIFKELGQVAIDTATPLVDLVKVSDDIALATKNAGDSTEEWKAKIIDLTTAVGIFTNLTGTQTVEGADKLSSAFKQLGVAPKDLLTVLNQVTAVAGGQSQAINDIVTALGGVGEAGRAAQIPIEQQIALVQVLGQVTNKSAADTATAFKNLFGSISSKGSEKILKEFGINIRDAQGGLRPFLDIYRDINKAVEDGTIPIQRYQDVLRGISGGPRRAPDAAALLGNLPLVEQAIDRATTASNEALVANAKILDTNQAKITQLQNAFNIALFEKFGQAVQDSTASLTDFLTTLINLFNQIDPNLVSLALTLGAITIAAKALSVVGLKLGPALAGSFVGFRKNIAFAIADIGAFIKQTALAQAINSGQLAVTPAGRVVNPATGKFAKAEVGLGNIVVGTAGGLLNKGISSIEGLGFAKATLGLGAAVLGVNALTTALTSNNDATKQSIGQALQLAGSLGLMTGVFTPLSIAALAAGTALQLFNDDTQAVTKSAHDAAVSTYDAIQALKTARSDVVTAESAQAEAKAKLDAVVATGKKDAETKQLQAQATDTYVTATLALAKANQVASDSFDNLLNRVGDLGDKYKGFKDLAAGGFISPQDIQSLAQQIAAEILKIQGGGTFNPNPIGGPKNIPFSTPNPQAPTLNPSLQFDQTLLNPENLQKLFDTNTGQATGIQIPPTQENLGRLYASLSDIVSGKVKLNLNQDQIDTLVKAVNDFLTANSTYFEIQARIASDQANVQALGAIGALSGPQLENANQRAALTQALGNLYNRADIAGLDTESRLAGAGKNATGVTQQQVIDLINQIRGGEATGQALTPDELKSTGEQLLALQKLVENLKGVSDEAFKKGMAQALIDVGVNADDVNKAFGLMGEQAQKSADEIQALADLSQKFDEASTGALNKFAQRQAQLVQQANSGDFDKNAKGLAALRAQSESAYKSEIKLIAAFKELATGSAQDQDVLDAVAKNLSKVDGLQNAATLSSDQLASALIDQALAAGVSSKGIKKLTDDVARLVAINETLTRLKATFNLRANVDVRGAITALNALLKTYIALSAAATSGPFPAFKQGSAYSGVIKQLQAALAELNNIQKSGGSTSLQRDIQKILAGGTGSNFGKTPSAATVKKGAGLDVSTLDIPQPIIDASNRNALIQEAIKNARALQAKIPGAAKDAKNDVVELLNGTKRILEVRGIKEDLLRKSLEELAAIEQKRLDFETKADTIRRIRIGGGSFAALANVPVNSTTGVSLGGPQGPINVTLNLNGTVLTPAQLAQFADLIAASLKRQIANG